MKKMIKRWCEYQNHSNFSRRLFSRAKKTMMNRVAVIIHPVTPGPVVKLAAKKATTRWPVVVASVSAIAR
jgi:quinolinate synthase